MGSESSNNHSDNLRSSISGIIFDNNADEDHKDEDDGEDDEDDSDVDSEDNATSSPTTSNKKHKYNAVQGIIMPGDDDMKANSNMAKSYPYLSRALGGEDGFDTTDLCVVYSSLVGIDVVRTPDLGRGGAHAGGVASRQEEVHPCHIRARSPPP